MVIVLLLLNIALVSADVFINEILPNVGSTDWDKNGTVMENDDEWVELYNNGTVDVNISGWNISDKSQVRHTFPTSTILGAGGYVVVFDLSLVNGDDNVSLFDNSSNMIDSYNWSVDPTDDVSIGRLHDSLSIFTTFTSPTLNATNNRVPSGNISNQTISEDVEESFNITSITDDDNDILYYTITGENVSEVNCSITNSTFVSMLSAKDWYGNASCIVGVNDTYYSLINKTFYITVNPVNDAPVIDTNSINITIEDLNYTYDVNATDVEGDNISFSLSVNPSGMVINSTDGVISWLPTNSNVGLHNVKIKVNDTNGGYSNQSYILNVTNVNDAPVLNAIGNQTVVQDGVLTITLGATDVDPTNDNMTYGTDAAFGTLNATSGLFTWTPNASYYGDYTVMFNVSDGNGGEDNETINIRVYSTLNISDVDVSVNPTYNNIEEGQIIQNVTPGQTVTTTITVDNKNAANNIDDANVTLSVSGLGISEVNQLTNPLTTGSSDTESISFKVPTLVSEGLYEVKIETEGYDFFPEVYRYSNFSYYINVTKQISDVVIENASLNTSSVKCSPYVNLTVNVTNKGKKDFDDVNVSVTQSNLGLSDHDVLSLDGNTSQTVSYIISTANKAAGSYNVSVLLRYYSDTLNDTATATLTIENCEPVNSTTIPDITILEDGFNDTIDLDDYFTDYNNDTLTFNNSLVTNIGFVFLSSGVVNITPVADFNGTEYVNFTASDGVNTTKSNQVKITVTPVNDAPTIIAISDQNPNEGDNFTYQVEASDIENDTLTYDLKINGTAYALVISSLKLNGSGYMYNWTPTDDDVNSYYVFNVSVSDGTDISYEDFILTVANVNNGPDLGGIGNKSLNEDELLQFYLNASDVDLPDDILSYSCNQSVLSVSKINNTLANVTWTPTNDYVGNMSLKCTVTDNESSIDSEEFVIEVVNVNDAPSITTTELPYAAIGELYEEYIHASDDDLIHGDNLTFVNSTNMTGLEMTKVNSSSVLISWNPNITGIYSYNITVRDKASASDNASFTVEVKEGISVENLEASIAGSAFYPVNSTNPSEVEPGDNIDVRFTVKNLFRTKNLEHPMVNITLKDEDTNSIILEKTLHALGEISGEKTETIDIGNIPTSTSDNKVYRLDVLAFERDNSTIADEVEAKFKVDLEDNEIELTSVKIDDSTLECNRTTIVRVNVSNTGYFSQDVTVSVENSYLAIDSEKGPVTIASGNSHEFDVQVQTTLDKADGTYTFDVMAYSSDAGASGSIDVNLGSCNLTVSPDSETVVLTEDQDQTFEVTNVPSGFGTPSYKWYRDTTEVGTSSSYTYTAENDKNSKKEYTIEVQVKDGGDYTLSNQWDLIVSPWPIASTFDGDTTSFSGLNDSQLVNMSPVVLEKAGIGKIEFLDPLNLTDVVDLDSKIKITSDGIVAVDTDAYAQLKKEARITLTGLSLTEEPTIYIVQGFTINPSDFSSASECGSICTIESWDSNSVTFTVKTFSSYKVGTTGVGNSPTAVASASPQTTTPNTQVTLNGGSSSDSDGSISSYLWTQTSGTSVTLTNANSATATFTPTQTGSYAFKLTVTDNDGLTDDDSITITVQDEDTGATGNLTISDLDVKVEGESDKDLQNGDKISEEARPGDTVKFDIELANGFSDDMKIEDIEITVTIENIDDGDDLEEEDDIEDIDEGDEDSVVVEFTIPTLVDEGDYDVIIEADGEDEDGNDHDVRWELTLEVKKDKHSIIIDDADLSPSTVRCSRSSSLDIEIVNVGREDEDDVSIEVTSSELDIDVKEEDIELEEGDDDDSVYDKTIRLLVDNDVRAGTYPIDVKAYYDGKEGDEETLYLTVEKCVDVVTSVGAEDVDVITTKDKITKPEPAVTKISFRDTSEYLTLMAILFVILLGGVVFLIGAAIILIKKK